MLTITYRDGWQALHGGPGLCGRCGQRRAHRWRSPAGIVLCGRCRWGAGDE